MVYIKDLNKNVFPNYIAPLKDELFSSWLCRLALAHDIKPLSFIQNYFGREYPIWNRDIDMLAPRYLLNKILNHTPLEEHSLNDLFLESLQSFAFLKRNEKGVTNNVIPLGIKHRKRKRYGQLFCPKCLSLDEPYYKKKWRLISSLVCTKCNLRLLDRCPNCESPIAFFRINISNNNISIIDSKKLCFCFDCNFDLRNTELEDEIATIEEIKYQRFIDKTIENGYNVFSSYSFLFFKGIFLLAKRLRSSTKNNIFRYAIQQQLNVNLPLIDVDFRLWNIDQRRETLNVIYSLLENYPNKLNKIFEGSNVTMSNIYGEKEKIPYWLEHNIIHREKKQKTIYPY